MEDFELKISQLIDLELPPEEQKKLFKELSTNDKLLKFFNDQILLRNNIVKYYSQIEFNDNALIPSVNKFKNAFYISAAAAVFLILISLADFFNKESLDQYQPVRDEITKLESIVNKNSTKNIELNFEFYSLRKKFETLEEKLKRDPL